MALAVASRLSSAWRTDKGDVEHENNGFEERGNHDDDDDDDEDEEEEEEDDDDDDDDDADDDEPQYNDPEWTHFLR